MLHGQQNIKKNTHELSRQPHTSATETPVSFEQKDWIGLGDDTDAWMQRDVSCCGSVEDVV